VKEEGESVETREVEGSMGWREKEEEREREGEGG